MFRISSYTYLLGWFDVLRHVPSWLQTFVANLSEKKFIPEKKNFPQLKGRAVEVRALTEPLLKTCCLRWFWSVHMSLMSCFINTWIFLAFHR